MVIKSIVCNQYMKKRSSKNELSWLSVRSKNKALYCTSQINCALFLHHLPLSEIFFPCLFLTFNTLISHVRTNPHLKLEKFSSGAAAEIGAEWQQLIELMVWVSEGL